ncbi:hypothetical protein BDV12DRAFT_186685 [Aspergillus spectabilis]
MLCLKRQTTRLHPSTLLTRTNRLFYSDFKANNDWFRYTRGRFVANENHEKKIRQVGFNIFKLAKRAAESRFSTYSRCARTDKFPDGMFNKAFLFTIQDGKQVMGKVPNPNARRPHYTTASGVQNRLGTPVPKVLSWSSNATDNPVGAEHIIMEKVPGIQLDEILPKMHIKDKFELVKTISRYQKAWNVGIDASDSRFAVGPLALDFDRGPYICSQELPPILQYLLPTDNSTSSSILCHPDYHSENIFAQPDRSEEILSTYNRVANNRTPPSFRPRHDGPQLTSLDRPASPANHKELSPNEQEKAQSLYLSLLFKAMEFQNTPSFDMMLLAQNLLVDGEAVYYSRILDFARNKKESSNIPGVQAAGNLPFPIRISSEEASATREDISGTIKAMELMQNIKESLGELWPEKGIVRPDQYDEGKRRLEKAKIELVDRVAHSEVERTAWGES